MINKSGVLHIKKRTFPEWLAYYIFIMPFLLSFLLDFLGLPSFIKYTIDAAWVLATLLVFLRKKVTFNRNLIPFVIISCVFFVYTFIGYIFNYQSVLYYLWGFRNNFRFYFVFIIFCMLFTEDDIKNCLKFLDILFWINALVTMFQFFVLGYNQDNLGGIFGVERGCNAYTIVFFSIIISKSILMFMSKKEGFILCFAKIAVALIISAMAELKFFFVVFVIILMLSTFLTSFAWRKFIVLLFAAILIVFASSILTYTFGEGSEITFAKLFDIATSENYSSNEDLGRLTAIPTLSRTILSDVSDRLFGLGLGNCDSSNFAVFNTPFYQTYGDLHYIWFSAVFLFLETGFVGLSIFIVFFVMCFVFAFVKKKEAQNPLYCQMAMIMSVLCVFIIFYNASLRTEVGYMVYFVLALPLIQSENNSLINLK